MRYIIMIMMVLMSLTGWGQSSDESKKVPKQTIEKADAQREEIQRYFGYEDVLFRYLTLPYDVQGAVNQRGGFLDTGYLYLSLAPLVLLGLLYRRKKTFYGMMVVLILYLAICFYHSYILGQNLLKYNPVTEINSEMTVNPRLDGLLLEPAYKFTGLISRPIVTLLTPMTGDRDHISYPMMGLILIVALYLILRSNLHQRYKMIGISLWMYTFLWWIFSAGIIWYGILFLALGYAYITKGYNSITNRRYPSATWIGMVMAITILSWCVISTLIRISNNGLLSESHEDYGKRIADFRLMPYTVGQVGREGALRMLGANVYETLEDINSHKGIIIDVSSPFGLEIKDSHKRVFEDNTLSYFNHTAQQLRTRGAITDYYYQRGVRYFLLDLHLRGIDYTPEQTLTKKFIVFTNGFIKDNPRIELVGTDQIIETASGEKYFGYHARSGEKVSRIGSYAVFKILP